MKYLHKPFSAIAILMVLLSIIIIPRKAAAQGVYKLSANKDAGIQVLGSSNVHDWTMASTEMESQAAFKLDKEGQLVGLTSLSFVLNVKSLKSEHSGMDDRTYKTIKADQYPRISYKLLSATIIPGAKGKCTIKTIGELTIAGVTQTITIPVNATVNSDNSIYCTGSQAIKLTDYKIDPPSFMLGAMKVKNDLTIQFKLFYKN